MIPVSAPIQDHQAQPSNQRLALGNVIQAGLLVLTPLPAPLDVRAGAFALGAAEHVERRWGPAIDRHLDVGKPRLVDQVAVNAIDGKFGRWYDCNAVSARSYEVRRES
jgi:hypothetical protein